LPDKPVKAADSSIICLDIIDSSEKKEIFQFNNITLLHTACHEIIGRDYQGAIYKGMGDGFIISLPSMGASRAIEFCEKLIQGYLIHTKFIRYRIGIEYGDFFSYHYPDQTEDVFGITVINAFRIADFGNNNTILLSESAAVNLRTASDARKENISELGYCIDKHRKPHKVFNYWSAIAGGEFK
jgi:hypothetical protein